MRFFALAQTFSPKKELQVGGGYEKSEGKSGTLTVTACVSSGSARYAMPAIPELVYAALLYPDGNPKSEDFVEGTKSADEDKLLFSFQRPDDESGLTLEIFAFKKGIVAEDFSIGNAIFSGSKDGLSIVGDAIVVNGVIALDVNKLSEEKGSVSLNVTVPIGCSFEINDTTNFNCEKDETVSDTYIVSKSEIAAGVYPVTFTVRKDGEIIYIFSENINILPGLHTEIWSGLAKGEAKVITQSVISNTVYVRGTGEGWYTSNAPSVTASDANFGSFSSPFATIQKAVDTVIARNAFTNNFTIYLDGTFTANFESALADFNALSLTQPLSVKIAGVDASNKAILDGNKTARGIVVGSDDGSSAIQKDMNLTLENLVVQNTKHPNYSGCGGGITLCCKAGNSHLIKNCDIKGNNAGYGSAIYNIYGSLDLQGCVISNNTAAVSGTVNNGQESAILTMSDVKIKNNSATNGGGVFLMNDSTLKISDASVVIKDNSSSTLYRGKGICVWYGILELSGSAKIDDGVGFPLSGASNHKQEIVIADALSESPVATITPSYYVGIESKSILVAGGDIEKITNDICDQFIITPQDDGTTWKIVPSADGTGVLQKVGEGTD